LEEVVLLGEKALSEVLVLGEWVRPLPQTFVEQVVLEGLLFHVLLLHFEGFRIEFVKALQVVAAVVVLSLCDFQCRLVEERGRFARLAAV
jgi:hypothetical protein